jgi:hypothetical protein
MSTSERIPLPRLAQDGVVGVAARPQRSRGDRQRTSIARSLRGTTSPIMAAS